MCTTPSPSIKRSARVASTASYEELTDPTREESLHRLALLFHFSLRKHTRENDPMIARRFSLILICCAAIGAASAHAADVIPYYVSAGTDGGATYGNVSGMRFSVTAAVTVSPLGMFDDPSNGAGFNSQPAGTPIKVSIWDRDTQSVISQLLFGGGTGDG